MSTKNKRIENLLVGIINEAEQEYLKESVKVGKKELFVERYVKEHLAVSHPELLEESWKEVVLSLALLANVALVPAAKAQAQQSVRDSTTIEQVNQVLNSPESMNIAINTLETQGYKDAEQKIESNAQKLKDQLEKKGYKTVHRTSTSKELKNYMSRGYAITKAQSDTIYTEVQKMDQEIPIVDTITMGMDAGNFFVGGAYTISTEGVDSIQNIIEQIQSQNGVVLAIRIESSTDKQRVSDELQQSLGTKGYSADNQGLSQARSDVVKRALINTGVDSSLIQQTVLAEQGVGTSGAETPQDASARYVKITIDAVQVSADAEAVEGSVDTVTTVINTFELAKAVKSTGGTSTRLKKPGKISVFKTQKSTPDKCPVWGK